MHRNVNGAEAGSRSRQQKKHFYCHCTIAQAASHKQVRTGRFFPLPTLCLLYMPRVAMPWKRTSPAASNEPESSSTPTEFATAATAPLSTSPLRAAAKSNAGAATTPQRPRMNSRDIPRTYSGSFDQAGDDLLPFELARNWHTDWLERGEFFFLYLGGVLVFQFLLMAILDTVETVPVAYSWTITNAVHCLGSIVYLHWLKGSSFDKHNDLSAMTLWEQLEGRPNTVGVKRALTMVPTLLCYAACHFSNYDYDISVANVVLWSIHVFAKLPLMNGVRIFGINTTTGIDDFAKKEE